MFSIEKLAQVTAYLLGKYDFKLNYTKLIKELYLADREALRKSNQTISGDTYVCMNNGPVLSRLYDLIRGACRDKEKQDFWNARFSTDGYDLLGNFARFPEGKLSRFDKEILDSIDSQFHNTDFGSLINYVHNNCPEWEYPGVTSTPLPTQRILKNLEKTDDEIEWILAENRAFDEEEKVFSALAD
jgi:hypothetical protein